MKMVWKLLGLKRPGSYIQKRLNQQNLKMSIPMSLLTMMLSIIMLLSMSQYQMSILSIRLQRFIYSCLLLVSLSLLIIAMTNISKKKINHKVFHIVLYIYIITCLAFGIINSVLKYSTGDHLISYVAMTIWVFFFFILRPVYIIGISAVEFLVMYVLMEKEGLGYYDTTEIFILWMILVAVCILHFQKSVHGIVSDHKIQEMNREKIKENRDMTEE